MRVVRICISRLACCSYNVAKSRSTAVEQLQAWKIEAGGKTNCLSLKSTGWPARSHPRGKVVASFSDPVTTIFVVAMVGGATALDVTGRLVGPAAVPDLPAIPCKQQGWLNADRGCQTWTARGSLPVEVTGAPQGGAAGRAPVAAQAPEQHPPAAHDDQAPTALNILAQPDP